MDSDAFFEKEYENLNDAIFQAIVNSKEVQKILLKLKDQEEVDQMAVLNLFLSMEELYEIISDQKNNSMVYKLEPLESKQPKIKEKFRRKTPPPENKANTIDGKSLSLNETLFENFCQGKFNEESWMKKARIRF